jgi:excisionase family DNA binding protein
MSDRLRTAAEIAARLAVPVSWVREHTRSGEIPCVTLGRYRRYRDEDVDAWVDQLAVGNGPRFRRYHPKLVNAPRAAPTAEGPTPKE